jgi:D-hydroxyproline dehydrogenase subunit gamma
MNATRPATLEVRIDGVPRRLPAGTSVAAALQLAGDGCTRVSVGGERRAPLCGMGICHECRVLIDGQVRLACQAICHDGMAVDTR